MQDRSARRRPRIATAVLAAVAVLGSAVLSGCDSDGDGTAEGAAAGKRKPPAAGPVWDRSPKSLAAVGDSITRGFDACSVLTDCPEVSWATGTDNMVRSLAVRLLGEPGATARSWNHARTGARIAELPEQMVLAAKEKPELVTVMIGANDACRDSVRYMTPVADFRSSFETAMRQLRAGAPKAQVYVSSVPDLMRLWETGRDKELVKRIWSLGVCRSMLSDPDDMGAEAVARRASVQKRVVAYNEVLRDVCAKDTRCRHDGGAVFAYPFTGAQLSQWDWFHPGRDGQARLAEIAYRNVTAERPPA
ncbi:SGNH/GDSL hydrolase family protein [Streptomyces sp. NPDC014735]|uniref:SGNH/GDSL hydrolase family protein n=1 Tax=unclassified Streptomyces TaxID=2593676 RepID=UPI0036FD9DA8